ncbi:MAG: hypothetical protein ABEJ03_05205 [Candidatus Nanohaloarchaea archaeon]
MNLTDIRALEWDQAKEFLKEEGDDDDLIRFSGRRKNARKKSRGDVKGSYPYLLVSRDPVRVGVKYRCELYLAESGEDVCSRLQQKFSKEEPLISVRYEDKEDIPGFSMDY